MIAGYLPPVRARVVLKKKRPVHKVLGTTCWSDTPVTSSIDITQPKLRDLPVAAYRALPRRLWLRFHTELEAMFPEGFLVSCHF